MDYYDEIKNKLVDNQVYKRVKDYSKNRNDLETYYNVGKLLSEAGKHYGEGIIKEYSKKLTEELGKKYSVRYLFDIRKLYLFSKVHPLDAHLTLSHYRLLFRINDDNEINYYVNKIINNNLSKRDLENVIKSNEYRRINEITKIKLINEDKLEVSDFVKNPIIINNKNNYDVISEKVLQKLILEDIESFMKELGDYFCFIGSEYKIKIGNSFNYIDLLLFNIKFKCYVVIELKKVELKKENIGQIKFYMNYVDRNIKTINENNTIGIIIVKRDNKFVIEYSSDERIVCREYELV